jgi:hypothetical protein
LWSQMIVKMVQNYTYETCCDHRWYSEWYRTILMKHVVITDDTQNGTELYLWNMLWSQMIFRMVQNYTYETCGDHRWYSEWYRTILMKHVVITDDIQNGTELYLWNMLWSQMILRMVQNYTYETCCDHRWYSEWYRTILMKHVVITDDIQNGTELYLWNMLWSQMIFRMVQNYTYETCCDHYIRSLGLYCYYLVNISTGGLLIPERISYLVVSASTLIWFIRYIYYWNLQFLNNVHYQDYGQSASGYPV